MGSEVSKNESKYLIEKQYKFIAVKSSELYGDIKIMRDERNFKLIAIKSLLNIEEKTFEKQQKHLKTYAQINNAYIQRIMHIYHSSFIELCTNFYKLYISFDYYPDTLDSLSAFYHENHYEFTDSELFSIIYSVLQVLEVFRLHSIPYNSLCPRSILINPENYCILYDVEFFMPNSYIKFFSGSENSNKCFLSPILFSCLKHRNTMPEHNSEKSNVFSLAMTIIYLIEGAEKFAEIYNFDEFYIDFKRIHSILADMSQKYSKELIEMLRKMVVEEEENRTNYRILLNFFEKRCFKVIPLKFIKKSNHLQGNSVMYNNDGKNIAEHLEIDYDYIEITYSKENFLNEIENFSPRMKFYDEFRKTKDINGGGNSTIYEENIEKTPEIRKNLDELYRKANIAYEKYIQLKQF